MIAIKKILVPTDFSDLSAPAIGYAISLARNHQAEVLVLHSIGASAVKQHFSGGYDAESLLSPGEPAAAAGASGSLERLLETKKQILETFLEQRIGSDLLRAARVRPLIRVGKVVDEIVAAAKEEQCDLIAMPILDSALRRLVFGTLANRVVRLAPCPVLIIQASAEVRTENDQRIPVKLMERWAA